MVAFVLGLVAALGSAVCYSVGVTMQAREAREAPESESLHLALLRRLVKRRRWVVGTLAVVSGWVLQALALGLAPLTVVQPALALGLVVLLVVGARLGDEDVGTREAVAVAAIVAGVAGLALAAPKGADEGHADPLAVGATLAVFGALVLAPYALRGPRRKLPYLVIFSAGLAYAWSALSTKFMGDAAFGGAWLITLMWLAATAAAALLGLVSEMTALQERSAIRVFPGILVIQIVVAVVLGPLLGGERWTSEPFMLVALAASLAVVVAGTALLASAPMVGTAVDTGGNPQNGATREKPESPPPRAAGDPAPAARALTTSETAGRSPSGASPPVSPQAPSRPADRG
jgi:drug/metabolite transporter (DMT)-like permease